ncbi:PspA/IM30 family protein [Burkholderia cepacia]|uniref:PspA/IM30 family protein n=1 Tax=Burkholderia cepacia TaxID=292 RepID=UPI002AB6AD9D|nr:PspA/IM30 family protein [Burkholderia cepacia]
MANSIVKRLLRLIRATAHDTLDNIENPGATTREMLRELRAEIAKTEEATASVMADQKAIQKKREDAHAAALDWNQKAEQAVRQQRDDLATAALEYATRAERNVAAYDQSLAILTPRVEALRGKLEELRGKLEDANNESELLDARAKAASASSRAARVLGDVGDNPIDFGSVRARVDRIEAQSEALEQIAHDKAGTNIDAELAKLTRVPVADRLAELKEKVAATANGSEV